MVIGGYDSDVVHDINRFRWYSCIESNAWILHIKEIFIRNTAIAFKDDKTFLRAGLSLYDDAIYVKTDIMTNIYNVMKGYQSGVTLTVDS